METKLKSIPGRLLKTFPSKQTEVLENFYQKKHYPDYSEKEMLAAEIDLNVDKISDWFNRRRAREKLGLSKVFVSHLFVQFPFSLKLSYFTPLYKKGLILYLLGRLHVYYPCE